MKYFITGIGTLGSALVKRLYKNNEVVVYSNDEYAQSEVQRELNHKNIEYWLGDVRDLERLKSAMDGCDKVIHTAALKRMDTTSHNVIEVADVNIIGTKNIMIAARWHCISDVIVISTDKAFQPTCHYGASKMIAEGIALANGAIVWRFGNFIGSRGSVWEIFKKQKENNQPLTITDPNATRFVVSVDQVVEYVLSDVKPGLHYPKNLKSMSVMDIANEIAPGHPYEIIGLREGEKQHESFNNEYTSYERH